MTDYVQEEIKEIIPTYDASVFADLPLSPNETLFVFRYCETDNSADAYRDVFGETNYAKCKAEAKKMLRREPIKKAVERMGEAIFNYAIKTLPMALIQDIQAVRNLDILDFYEADGTARMLDAIPYDKRKYIENIDLMVNSRTGDVYTKYILPSKSNTTKLLLDLLKLKELTTDKTPASVNDKMREAEEMRRKVLGDIL